MTASPRFRYRIVHGHMARGTPGVQVVRDAREAVRIANRTCGTIYVHRGALCGYPIGFDSQETNAERLSRLRQCREYLDALEPQG